MSINLYDTSRYIISKSIDLLYILVNFCQYVACSNGGICQQANTPQCFTCVCPVGFTGNACEIKENRTTTSKTFEIKSFLMISIFLLQQIHVRLDRVFKVVSVFL